MNANDVIQPLGISIYEEPLVHVREERDYPNLANPLHLVMVLIDADVEITMNGMLGFLENNTGEHLHATAEAMRLIGAPKCAEVFDRVEAVMTKHDVTWRQLRGDTVNAQPYEVTNFRKMHGARLDAFAREIGQASHRFLPLNALYSPEDAFAALCAYMEPRVDDLVRHIETRKLLARQGDIEGH